MGKRIMWIVMAIALLVLIGSGSAVLVIQGRYQASRQAYEVAAETYVLPAVQEGGDEVALETAGALEEKPPITVDFAQLQADDSQVAGWLYCPDTEINYPVMQGSDNDFYLHHNYTGAADQSGAIFVDAQCAAGFADANSIIYGHSMRDGSMFGKLNAWKDPAYYADHPVMWLLTPEQNYRVRLFSGYTTAATSGTYTIVYEQGEELEQYLANARYSSDFATDFALDGEHYVVLSTCAYEFDQARYVLHGMLEPVG